MMLPIVVYSLFLLSNVVFRRVHACSDYFSLPHQYDVTSGEFVVQTEQPVNNASKHDTVPILLPILLPVKRGRPPSSLKDLTCAQCGRVFKRAIHCRRHKQSAHVRDKSFSCAICSKRFNREDNRNRHQKSHERKKS